MGKNEKIEIDCVIVPKTVVIREDITGSMTPKTPKPNESIVKQPKTK